MRNKGQHWIMLFRRLGFHYFMALFIVLGIKYWYAGAGSEELEWILAPTARCVQVLGGIPFEKAPQNGYVNHSLRFMIAPSCSGVQFMLIAFSVLAFPFLYRVKTAGRRWGWMVCSMGAAYVYTIMTNGLRIILAVYLPDLLGKSLKMTFFQEWLTPEKLHTLIGTVVYFASLLLLYRGAERLFGGSGGKALKEAKEAAGEEGSGAGGDSVRRTNVCILRPVLCNLPPAACYFAVVLGMPFLHRIYRNEWEGFWSYALLVSVTCASVLLCFGLAGVRYKRGKSKRR